MAEREHDGTGATRERRYPLGEGGGEGHLTHRRAAGRADSRRGARRQLRGEDFTIHPDTLRQQASFAEEAAIRSWPPTCAAPRSWPPSPMTGCWPSTRRCAPYRLGYEQLLALAHELASEHGAPETARYVREAAEAYRRRGLG